MLPVPATLSPMSRRATYQDLLDAPEHLRAEIVGGELLLSPAPAAPHAFTATSATIDLGAAFRDGGPSGGWVILATPELWLGHPEPRDEVLVPDLAAWRRERYAEPVPRSSPGFTVRPDWVAEVLSPSTVRRDRITKLALYAREAIPHAWILDPLARTVEVFALTDAGVYALVATSDGSAPARLPPFDAVELPVQRWWSEGGEPQDP